jgi:hypothetical protein
MARVDTIKLPVAHTPSNDVGAFGISVNYAIGAAEAVNGDRLTLLEFDRDGVIFYGGFAVAGSVGAAATLQLQHSNTSGADDTHTSITGATTAAGADREPVTRCMRFTAGDTVSLLVGGGNIGVASTVQLDLVVSHNPVLIQAAFE